MSVERLLDDFSEAAAALTEKIGRTISTAVALTAAIAVAVGFAILADTTERQVSSRFDALRSTTVLVRSQWSGTGQSLFPASAPGRLLTLNGVESASIVISYGSQNVQLSSVDPTIRSAPLVAVSPDIVGTASCTLRGYVPHASTEPQRVVALGSRLAADIGVSQPGRTVLLSGAEFTVVGIMSSCGRMRSLEDSVATDLHTGDVAFGAARDAQQSRLIVSVAPGAGAQISRQAPVVVDVAHPDRYLADAPPDPQDFREAIQGDTRRVVAASILITLLIGLLTMTNAASLRVREQRADLGLRRALGASRRRVVGQIVLESMLLGFAAALVGNLVAIAACSAMSLAYGWQLVLNPLWPAVAIVLGPIVGGLTGLSAARFASSVEPREALQLG